MKNVDSFMSEDLEQIYRKTQDILYEQAEKVLGEVTCGYIEKIEFVVVLLQIATMVLFWQKARVKGEKREWREFLHRFFNDKGNQMFVEFITNIWLFDETS